MSRVFIGCSSYEDIPKHYFEEAKNVAKSCANAGYDLVFGSRTTGLMGEVYKEYKLHNNVNIEAICMEAYKEDLNDIDDVKSKVLFSTTVEQMDYFMNTDLLLYLPGGFGTLTELIYLINAKANKFHNKKIIIVNTHGFYDKIIEHFNKLLTEGFISNIDMFIEIKDLKDLENVL